VNAPCASAAAQPSRRRRLGRGLAWLSVGATALALCAAQARAATFFRSGATSQDGSGSSSLAINVPAGVVAGDVMLATVDAETGSGFTAPSCGCWSSTGLYNGPSNVGWSAVYFHVATSSEPSSYTWGLGSSRRAVGKMGSYLGVDNAAPIQTSAANLGSASPATAPSITTSTNNEMVLVGAAGKNTSGSFSFTNPASTTDRAAAYSNGTNPIVGSDSADFIQATAGATGTKSFSISPTSTPWGALTLGLTPNTTGALGFNVAPDVPVLSTVALNGQAQTTNATMSNLAVDDSTGSSPTSGSGWNVSVVGGTGAGQSAVFNRYCNSASACNGGADPANSYVTGGQTLPAGSLKLNTTGASWTTNGGSGTPTFQAACSSGCPLDGTSTTKIASAAANAGRGAWRAGGFTGTSLALSTPTTMRVLPANEVYRVDLVWSLNSGP
jgi:hypothetical protein